MVAHGLVNQLTALACPCGFGDSFNACCALLHAGQPAQSAEQLMRSRYSAYATQNIDYIVQTTLPIQQQGLDIDAMTAWSKQNQWQGLTIHRVLGKANSRHAQVEFTAAFTDAHGVQTHRELSGFVYIAPQWYFLDPTLSSYPALKSMCFCGSGQKFKRCCAPFLGII